MRTNSFRWIDLPATIALLALAVLLSGRFSGSAAEPTQAANPEPASRRNESSPYTRWTNGPAASEEFFPIAVWLQNPSRAKQYRAAGFNTYVGLWRGPTDEQLRALREAGMRVICHQNASGLKHRDDPTIIGWMHGDEPDNAQSLGSGKGYGPPILPAKIVADYERLKAVDPSRPILLNLGQGVAWDGWHGRGVRTRHPEDYPEYIRGCDIVSFDIYPVAHSSPEVAGNLWFVARGVERLNQWKAENQIVWNCIECTRIQHPTRKATPQQLRSEIWMALIHGSKGLIYFVHEWEPRFNEAALLDDPEMLAAATAINRQITELAPILNSPPVTPGATARSENAEVPVATRLLRHAGTTYLFAAAMRAGETKTAFHVPNLKSGVVVEVLGEKRKVTARDGTFEDDFGLWGVHLYSFRDE